MNHFQLPVGDRVRPADVWILTNIIILLYLHYSISHTPQTNGEPVNQEAAQKISVETVREAAEVLRCIGHPIRLRIVELLETAGELNVSTIRENVGLEQAIASQHLGLMRNKGILASRREGANVFYRVLDEKVTQVIECLRACDATRS